MIYCIKAKLTRNGIYYSRKFLYCKKHTPRIGFVHSKIGYLNNFTSRISTFMAFFNVVEGTKSLNRYCLMNRAAYRHIGPLINNEKNKKGRKSSRNFLLKI